MERLKNHGLWAIGCGQWVAYRLLLLPIAYCLLVANLSFAEGPFGLNEKAVELMNKGDFDGALVYLQKANDLSPTDEPVRKNLAICYTAIGNKKISQGSLADAILDFKSALYYSNDSTTRFYKGYTHYRLKEFDDAINELENAQELGLSSPDLYILIGKAFYDKGETVSAITSWKKGTERYPENEEIKELLGKAEREATFERGFKKEDTYHFTVQFDAEKDETIGMTVLYILKDAYSDVNLDLAHYPEGNTSVILYTRKDFKEVTQGPDWMGGIYDGKIRLPVGGVKDATDQLKAVLYHEYTHVVIGSMVKRKKVPTWLNEGVAEYEGARFFERRLNELIRAAREEKLIPIKRLEGDFSGFSGKESLLAYLQSYSLVKYIIDRFGFHAIRDILGNISRGDNIEASIKRALEVYNLDYDGLVAEWKESLK